jgi:hypothetical protein
MKIEYDDIDDIKKDQLTDLFSKREAIDSVLANIQTEKAEADIGWSMKEQTLKAEQNRLTEEMRKLRKAILI